MVNFARPSLTHLSACEEFMSPFISLTEHIARCADDLYDRERYRRLHDFLSRAVLSRDFGSSGIFGISGGSCPWHDRTRGSLQLSDRYFSGPDIAIVCRRVQYIRFITVSFEIGIIMARDMHNA